MKLAQLQEATYHATDAFVVKGLFEDRPHYIIGVTYTPTKVVLSQCKEDGKSNKRCVVKDIDGEAANVINVGEEVIFHKPVDRVGREISHQWFITPTDDEVDNDWRILQRHPDDYKGDRRYSSRY